MTKEKILNILESAKDKDGEIPMSLVRKAFEKLPSAQPERIKGRWVKMSDADGTYYCCSECGEELYRKYSYNPEFDLFPRKESIDKTNFCMFCGAYMRDGEDPERREDE